MRRMCKKDVKRKKRGHCLSGCLEFCALGKRDENLGMDSGLGFSW